MLNAYFVWSTGTELERRLVALRLAGDPIQLADLAHTPILPEKNADVFLRRAADDLDSIQKELLAYYPKRGYPPDKVAPADQEKLEKLFAAYPNVMPLLQQAADCPENDPQLDCTLPTTRFIEFLFKRPETHRLLNRVMLARSALLLSKGRLDDALSTQMLTLRLARRWRREPLMIGYLVTVACETAAMEAVNRVLQAGPVAPSARKALDAELALHDTMDGYNWALQSERAFSLSSIRELPSAVFGQARGSGTDGIAWLYRGMSNDAMLRVIELYDNYLEKGSRPYAAVVSEQRAATRLTIGVANPLRNLVTLLEPSLAAIRDPAERTRAMARSVRVLNAIQTRAPSGSDQVPKLTDLGLPSEATIDPYNSEPLRLKKLPGGWMVYSVGRNLVDDGGILDYKNDLGVGPISRAELEKKR
jgi:hypothetical protein